jgi:hypothetical protein
LLGVKLNPARLSKLQEEIWPFFANEAALAKLKADFFALGINLAADTKPGSTNRDIVNDILFDLNQQGRIEELAKRLERHKYPELNATFANLIEEQKGEDAVVGEEKEIEIVVTGNKAYLYVLILAIVLISAVAAAFVFPKARGSMASLVELLLGRTPETWSAGPPVNFLLESIDTWSSPEKSTPDGKLEAGFLPEGTSLSMGSDWYLLTGPEGPVYFPTNGNADKLISWKAESRFLEPVTQIQARQLDGSGGPQVHLAAGPLPKGSTLSSGMVGGKTLYLLQTADGRELIFANAPGQLIEWKPVEERLGPVASVMPEQADRLLGPGPFPDQSRIWRGSPAGQQWYRIELPDDAPIILNPDDADKISAWERKKGCLVTLDESDVTYYVDGANRLGVPRESAKIVNSFDGHVEETNVAGETWYAFLRTATEYGFVPGDEAGFRTGRC